MGDRSEGILKIEPSSIQLYLEACKVFKCAINCKPGNTVILKDLTDTMLLIRDYTGYTSFRKELLEQKPGVKSNWLALVMGYHLSKKYSAAEKTLTTFMNNHYKNTEAPSYYFEKSQILLYRNLIIEESGDIQRALQDLVDNRQEIHDKDLWNEKLAKFNHILGDNEKAEIHLRNLIRRNPDNYSYYLDLFKARGLVGEDCSSLWLPQSVNPEHLPEILELVNEFAKEYPRAKTPKQLPLNFLPASDPLFRELYTKFVKPKFTQSAPSLFGSLKYLYHDQEKVQVIGEIVEDLEKNLLENGKFSNEEDNEPPSTIVWVKYFLSQHYSKIGEHEKALEYINFTIEHTPTMVELYSGKAKILKHGGQIPESAEAAKDALSYDGADKYLNTKAIKYLLRADMVDEARALLEINTQIFPPLKTDQYSNNCVEMQVIWYELYEAESWIRQGDMAQALLMLNRIASHFITFWDAQIQYHNHHWSYRQMTLSAYYKFIQFEDELYGHKFYLKAADKLVEVYLNLHDNPELFKSLLVCEDKNERGPFELAEALRKNNKKPLAEANFHLKNLEKYGSSSYNTHSLGYEVYVRKGKYLLAYKALKECLKLKPEEKESILERYNALTQLLTTEVREKLNPVVLQFIDEGL
eukprot:TRINITY_DN3320_c0_g1_i1.p1 TRINITY_DN3320_c0_g1~~TRINITY_DN3320_c0_g1_i1.p1  ORF type:complete len:639 (-),score=160.12 TRINITY_DN3320_c0_g1_i1:2-1918(-)